MSREKSDLGGRVEVNKAQQAARKSIATDTLVA